ncbi:MAG: shikimate dehydrogenase [Actinomycetota bacterium]
MTTPSFLDDVVGSFSTGAADNPTVAMMDAAFGAESLPWRYVNCEVEPADLTAAVDGARAMGWHGFNCSMPHKQAVIPLLDSLSPSATLCQAVNCVVRIGGDGGAGGWVGHNTDGAGFVASCRDLIDVTGVEAMVIGTGGAASAIAVELGLAGAARVFVAGRDADRAAAVTHLVSDAGAGVGIVPWRDPLPIPDQVRLVVDATPVGMTPDVEAAIDVDWSTLAPDSVVGDVVFNPAETAFLRAAAEAGATTVDGTGMLVNQAAENIRLWTGSRPATGPMRAALEDAIGLS